MDDLFKAIQTISERVSSGLTPDDAVQQIQSAAQNQHVELNNLDEVTAWFGRFTRSYEQAKQKSTGGGSPRS